MAIDHLTLPNYVEPPPRLPVVARYCGPVLSALRRTGGYRFDPAAREDATHPWIGRAFPQRGKAP